MDPFVDDNVTMAKRLKALGKDVGLNVLNGLPHGFLNFVQVIILFPPLSLSLFLSLFEIRNTKIHLFKFSAFT